MSNYTDTIVGIATAYGQSGISIIRVSGDQAIAIVDQVFKKTGNQKSKKLANQKSHTISYGHIYQDQQIIDEVLVSVFLAPRSYTGENVVEINCHGGIYVTTRILDLVVKSGARLSLPGEFTKRAFLNGRIDLTKAEAVMDVIGAENENALKMANQGLRGDIYKMIVKMRQKLFEVMSAIIVNIDYPEYDDFEEMTIPKIKQPIKELLAQINQVISRSDDAKKLKNGINTVILGKPNVGKSSILNALLREEKAIVTAIEGTTRDVIESKFVVGSVVLNLIDTAGIRKTNDLVEQIGVNKSYQYLDKADLILLILDGSKKLSEEDRNLLKSIKDKKYLVIVNKKDLDLELELDQIKHYIYISSFNEEDILKLEEKIKEYVIVNDLKIGSMTYISNARQIEKLLEAKSHLEDAVEDINKQVDIDLIESSIRYAWNSLGEIIGTNSADELLEKLFASFCLGK